MARLRKVAVEVRRCPRCRTRYSERQCPSCGLAARPTTERQLFERLIAVDDPPRYERQERWHCPRCRNLYEPPRLTGVAAWARQPCPRCEAGSFAPETLRGWLAEAPTLLKQVRRLSRALRAERDCPGCGQRLAIPCWCPYCRASAEARPSAALAAPPLLARDTDLPTKPTWVYVPVRATVLPHLD